MRGNQAAQAVGYTNFCVKHIIWICYPNLDKFSLAAAHHWLPVTDQTLIPQPLHHSGYKQTAGLLLPDPTLIPALNRQQGWRSQTKRLSPTTTPQWLLADARVGSVPDRTLIPPILADARVGCVPDWMLIPLILADARVGNVPDPM